MRFTNLPSTSSAIDLGQNEAFRGNAGLSVVLNRGFHAVATAASRCALGITPNEPRLGIDTSVDTVVQLSDQSFGPLLEVRECIPC